MKLQFREYKFLVDHEPFSDQEQAIAAVAEEIGEAAQTIPTVKIEGQFKPSKTRAIVFLDTPDHTFRRYGLILRQRVTNKGAKPKVEYTLKCRSEDFFFASGADVVAHEALQAEIKLEEDIAPPFRSRFSRSATVDDATPRLRETPNTLGEAAKLFPVLATLEVDGNRCDPKTAVEVVSRITVSESVWEDSRFLFDLGSKEKPRPATLALILWARGKADRPAVAELSFRLDESDGEFTRELAIAARSVYTALQRMDCARLQGMTKTEYIYRDTAWD